MWEDQYLQMKFKSYLRKWRNYDASNDAIKPFSGLTFEWQELGEEGGSDEVIIKTTG